MSPLVLASASPQRKAILEQLGIAFTIAVSGAEELTSGPPDELVLENAFRKASAVARSHPDALILGVDTIVLLDGVVYGKPADLDHARATLAVLSGRRHLVMSGVCVLENGRQRSAVARTAVEFLTVDERLMDWYLASEEWRGRAGGYAIQGRGAALVAGIEGDYLNVVGLPVTTLLELAPSLLQDSSRTAD